MREVVAASQVGHAPAVGGELVDRLEPLLARGPAAYPGLDLPAEAFARCLARSVEGRGPASWETIAMEDLYLASACVAGVPGAAAAFERRYGRIIRRAVSRVLSSAADRDEAVQRTRQALLVGSAGVPPKIAQYLGHGSLESWVAVVAVRVAVSLGRSEGTERRVRDKAAAVLTDSTNPEILCMKSELRRELEAAIEEALGRLEDRARLVLRLYLVAGMTLTAIGKTLGVSQSTVSGLLARARRSLLARVRQHLATRLKTSKSDLASIARLVASQLDISISRVLADAQEDGLGSGH
ncbi:MAG TPA: sigma-70 family RNA polymerase sigma factor [Polyangia bacterium]|nr:sigma-70 family RNA polymerase sigma factor [Polyangia bacterium]